MRAHLASLVLALGAVHSCGDDGPMLPPAAEVGTGAGEFIPLVENDDIVVTQGPQGGFHVLGAVRVQGLVPGDRADLGDPDNPTTEFQVFKGTTRVDIGLSTYHQGLQSVGDGVYEMVGRLVILDITDTDGLDGETITLSVTATDTDGRTATDSINLIAVPDPINR